jgi:O-antigen biosynthesis protein
MGFGVPVVATSLAVEGMSLTAGEDIFIADTPEDFADAVIEVYQSQELWDKVSRNGLEKTKASYSIAAAQKQLSLFFGDGHTRAPVSSGNSTAHRVHSQNFHQGAVT